MLIKISNLNFSFLLKEYLRIKKIVLPEKQFNLLVSNAYRYFKKREKSMNFKPTMNEIYEFFQDFLI